jgi:hypothetical protein
MSRAGVWGDRCFGTLTDVSDSERRALRPIGQTVAQTVALTEALLDELVELPGSLLFLGVATPTGDLPRIPHAVYAGNQVILVESVSWPAGRYEVDQQGRIHCNSIYIGQSIRQLGEAVQQWRAVLSEDHHVGAVVVVHGPEALELSVGGDRDVRWATAADALALIRSTLSVTTTPSGNAVKATGSTTADAGPGPTPRPDPVTSRTAAALLAAVRTGVP